MMLAGLTIIAAVLILRELVNELDRCDAALIELIERYALACEKGEAEVSSAMHHILEEIAETSGELKGAKNTLKEIAGSSAEIEGALNTLSIDLAEISFVLDQCAPREISIGGNGRQVRQRPGLYR
jgi:hypothetical protein